MVKTKVKKIGKQRFTIDEDYDNNDIEQDSIYNKNINDCEY
jgi:hypothetical protein